MSKPKIIGELVIVAYKAVSLASRNSRSYFFVTVFFHV